VGVIPAAERLHRINAAAPLFMHSGSVHDNSKLPILSLGGLGGTLATSRVLDAVRQDRCAPPLNG
jgi:hypothetical protein